MAYTDTDTFSKHEKLGSTFTSDDIVFKAPALDVEGYVHLPGVQPVLTLISCFLHLYILFFLALFALDVEA